MHAQEFPARPRSYYEEALRDGRLRVEGVHSLAACTALHQGQTMRHLIHRHEPPVLDLPIPVRLQLLVAMHLFLSLNV